MPDDLFRLQPGPDIAGRLLNTGRAGAGGHLERPGKAPPSHWHPSQQEHFEVLDGELTVQIDGNSPRHLRAGDGLDVPPRTAHSKWNVGTSSGCGG